MKTAYFDCFSGISGDMCLGALVDAGASLRKMGQMLRGLPVKGYRLQHRRVLRSGIAATKVDVILTSSSAVRPVHAIRWAEIRRIVSGSSLPDEIKGKGLMIFRRLFEAEGVVHGRRYSSVHLHETGAVDCIVDVFGTLAGMHILGIEAVCSSPVNLGGGSVSCSHGTLPVPAPAAIELLRGAPVYSSGHEEELATPTGAAIITSITSGFGPLPAMIPQKIALGAGQKELSDRPNVLRLIIGETDEGPASETVVVIETNIDDMNPQVYDYLYERLFSAGALDVWTTQIVMKKSRPAVLLGVMCAQERREAMVSILLRETTSIGLRYQTMQRVCMERSIRTIRTRFGRVRVKVSSHPLAGTKHTPEYEECRKIALAAGVPLRIVMDEVRRAAGTKQT